MMQAEFKRENHKSYFVIKDTRLDSNEPTHVGYDLEMLCENQIQGILPIYLHSFNGETELYYDISTKQTLRVLFEKKQFTWEDLKWLLRGIQEAVCGLEKYLLDMEYLLIDPDYIYINMAEKKVYLLYYPFSEESFETVVEKFAEYILDKICNEDEQTVVYAYNFYRFVKEEKSDLISVFQELEKSDSHTEREMEKPKQVSKQTQDETDEFFSVDKEALYLDDDQFLTKDIEQPLTSNHMKVKRVIIFSFFALFGVGIMAFEAWQNQLGFEELVAKKEVIVGFAVCILAVLGFVLFSLMDFVRDKARNRKNEILQDAVDNHKTADIENDFDFLPNMDKETVLKTGLIETNYNDYEIEDYKKCDKQDYENYEKTAYCETERDSFPKVDDMYETVLLQENCYIEQRILVGKIKGKKRQIDLSTFPFIIGKSKEQADYVIDDSSISRIHARFTLRDGIVYLTDLNSTNGSMKNGIKLQPNELVEVEAEDEIKFGRVTFTYY